MFAIKGSEYDSPEKDDFLICAYSLLNLFLTAVFKISVLEEMISNNHLDLVSPADRLESLSSLTTGFPAYLHDKAKYIIYCSDASEGKEMAGLLLYTASGDSEGTMGGLVRQGRPDTFPRMFRKAIESALTCSNDPVCSLSSGQGRDSLNMSACYSCTLIPETSCEEFNVFLDRGMIVGTFSNHNFGFFSAQLFEADGWNKPATHVTEGKGAKPSLKQPSALIIGTGTDMRDVPFSDIWKSLLQWSTCEQEKELLKNLIAREADFAGKEKPIQDCDFMLSGSTDKLKCDLLWKSSKVAFFTEENEEYYNAAVNTDWSCFCGNDALLCADDLLHAIKEVQ